MQELQQQLHLPPDGIALPAFLGNIEYTFIQEALELSHGNQVRAAALLGISRDQLRYRMSRYLQEESFIPQANQASSPLP